MTGTIEELEQHIENLKKVVELRDMALKLGNNREFKKVVLEDFCLHECARFAQASVNPMLKTEDRADAMAKAQAAGHFKQYLSVLVQRGNQAAKDIEESQKAIAEYRQENA